MTLTLDLPPELEARLEDEAGRRGIPVEEYAIQVLRHGILEEPVGAQIVAEWQRAGVNGCRPEITDSQAHARMLRERAETRERT
jgi:hypothetical protein